MKPFVIISLICIVGLVSIFNNQIMLGKSETLVDLNVASFMPKEQQKEKDIAPLNNATTITNSSNDTSNVTNIANNTISTINTTNSTNITKNNTGPARFSAEDNLTHFGTCPNTPGRDDLYWIRKEYADSLIHTAALEAYQGFITDKHTDLRFENKKPIHGPRRELLAHMFRDFARWCDHYSIKYFIAHGTLLGWYWNERILYWDEDMDIIIDFATFTYLLQFNSTMIYGRYKLELNPNYYYRGYGGLNVIDGMFIDTKTGVYIDITMLSESQTNVNTTNTRLITETPNCFEKHCIEDKSVHRYAYDIIYPLKRITFEGVGTWAPNNIDQHLDQEYSTRGRLSPEFYDEDPIGIDGPVRPQIIKTSEKKWRGSSAQYTRYGFDYELNDWVVVEVSDLKKKEMINNHVEIPKEDKKCLTVREIEYKSYSDPVWIPLWKLCRAKSEQARKLVAYKLKLKTKGAWKINCAACVRPMPPGFVLKD